MLMTLLAGMVAVGGRPSSGEVSEGTDRARLRASVKLWIMNSAIEQELHDRRVGPTQQALLSAALSL